MMDFLRIALVAIRALTLALIGASLTTAAEPTRRPNILWLVGENITHDLGCYGAKQVHTPHLDHLSVEGMRFNNAFATSPVCAPSRSAFMLGMYQTTTDTHHMRSHRTDDFRLPIGVQPITHRLQGNGYTTANIKTVDGKPVGTGKLDLNFANEGLLYQTDDWASLKSRQPFFAQINSHEVEYDIYDRQSSKKERVEWVGEQEHVQHATLDNVNPPPYYPDTRVTREEWARYLNSVSGMDVRVGWVLEQLRADGLEDDTIIIFFADNGRLEPRGIHWCYDCGLRVPLIIKWPKNFPPPEGYQVGGINDRIVSLIDLTATTLAFASISRPVMMQGRVLLGEQADPPRRFAFAARDRIDETVQRIRSVHDERYHYIRTFSTGPTFASLNRYKEKCFPILPLMRQLHAVGQLTGPARELMQRHGPCEELYDTIADRDEIHNLFDSSQLDHQSALLRLRSALDTWMIETADRGHISESPEIVAPFEKEMHDWFGTPAWAK